MKPTEPQHSDSDASELSRIGVAVPGVLLAKFDRSVKKKRYASSSEAFCDLMRDALIEEIVGNLIGHAVGTLTLVVHRLNDRLAGTQHDHYGQVVSTIRVHLDGNNCLEVVILRGAAKDIQHVADSLVATKGVRHGKLTLTTAAPG